MSASSGLMVLLMHALVSWRHEKLRKQRGNIGADNGKLKTYVANRYLEILLFGHRWPRQRASAVMLAHVTGTGNRHSLGAGIWTGLCADVGW